MRLIDEDALKATLLEYGYTTEHNQIFRYIDEQPTAYDIDKVVEELQKIEEHCIAMYDWQGQIAIDDAIEIVKQGGVSDDVCEWESVSDGEFIQNPHTKRLYSNEPSMKNVYCNTCGKKIKVVE